MDSPSPVIGWRIWHYISHTKGLQGLHGASWSSSYFQAECKKCGEGVPGPDCDCGIYSLPTPSGALNHLPGDSQERKAYMKRVALLMTLTLTLGSGIFCGGVLFAIIQILSQLIYHSLAFDLWFLFLLPSYLVAVQVYSTSWPMFSEALEDRYVLGAVVLTGRLQHYRNSGIRSSRSRIIGLYPLGTFSKLERSALSISFEVPIFEDLEGLELLASESGVAMEALV